MATENTRATALNWFHSNYSVENEIILTSKFYKPAESWSNSRVWFFQIPMEVLNPKVNRFIHLLCKNHLEGEDFIYLKVPVSFLVINEHALDVDKKKKVMRIYLSVEAADMFKEVRGKSRLDFSKYVTTGATSKGESAVEEALG